jgi:hypothetical protein
VAGVYSETGWKGQEESQEAGEYPEEEMRVTFADQVQPQFGIPFPHEFKWANGEVGPMDREAAAKLQDTDPARAKVLAHLMANHTQLQRNSPVGWGWQLPMWQKVLDNWKKYKVHIIFGGNRSTKSTFASRLMVDLMERIPMAELRGFHVNSERSRDDMQRFIWEALPLRLKEREPKKGINYSMLYSQKNGFSDAKLIIPPEMDSSQRGSTITFNNYKQYLMDAQMVEGLKAHAIWGDEEMPARLFDTLMARLTDYRGRMFLTFTTLQGWTDLVSSLLQNAETLESRYSDYMGMELPVMQRSKQWSNCAIYYFWSEDNIFIPHDELFDSYQGQPLEVKLARLYGIPSKSFHSRFPKFNPETNVIPHETIPFVKDASVDVTRYQSVDPAGGKNWTAIWLGVTEDDCVYVYREWPDSTYGDWALPHMNAAGRSVGKAGPAQRSLGYGYKAYADLFRELEDGEEIFERIMDPRMGRSTIKAQEGDTDIISEMRKTGIYYRPAPGLHIDHGLQRINELLSWNDSSKMTGKNKPKLYISDRCQNLVQCLKEYTAQSKDEASKDFVDCLRYATVTPVDYVGNRKFMSLGGGAY